jgi:hypothetical protein
MRKMSFILHACAIIVSATAAIASSKSPAQTRTLYYKSGNNFYPAGIENYDYVCQWDDHLTCTYYYNETTGQYVPNKIGKILFLR